MTETFTLENVAREELKRGLADGTIRLVDVRELRMITTNARKSAPGSPAAAEVRRRLDHLRRGEASIWHIL